MATISPRITAPKVMGELEKHLAYHENKLDPKLHNHHVILFGEKNDDGLCADVKELKDKVSNMDEIIKKLDRVMWTVIGAVILQVILAGINL